MKKYRYLIVSMLVAPGMVLAQQPPGPGPMARPAPGQPSRPGGPGGPGANRPDRPGPGRPQPGQGNWPSPGRPDRPTPLPGPNKPGRPPHHGNKPGRPQPGRPEPGKPGRPHPGRPQPGRPQPGRPGGGYHRPGEGRPPSFRPIHRPGFSYPHGYRYRRWSIGLLLPSIFLSSAYIYSNYWDVGVEAPPPGYYWVRYGPDLLLVQRGTRRIVDVIYGAFI